MFSISKKIILGGWVASGWMDVETGLRTADRRKNTFNSSVAVQIANNNFLNSSTYVIILQLKINFILSSKTFIFCSHANSYLKASFSVNLYLIKL